MTDEELDRARANEAAGRYVSASDSTTPILDVATIAARLTRTGWTPPDPVDPDLVEARRIVIEWLNDEAKGKLSELALAAIKAGREMERAKS